MKKIISILLSLALCLGMCPPVALAAAEEIDISQNWNNILTEEAGGCPGHTFTGTDQTAIIYVESGTHNVTFSGLNITASAQVGIAPDATMNLTINGTNTIQASVNLAGIYVPVGATLIINGTGSLNVSRSGAGAGIGGAIYAPDDVSDGNPDCGTVVINGGTITATGGSCCAGIGGGRTNDAPGNGGTVTISGGTVTAKGGSDNYFGGAGIGGSAGETDGSRAGSGGSLTISGGHVTLTAGHSTSYGFGQGSGSAPGGTCELTLADTSYLTVDSLDPNGKYTINGDPTPDMIVVPEDLIYNGKAQELDGKIYIDDSKTGTGTYFNQTFTVKASKDGWNYTISPAEVKEAGNYTVTFSKEGHTSISKTFTVAKSGTDLADGKVKTYNGSEETTSFTASDTITVKATPTPTGEAPTNSAMFAASFTEPGAGQMAVFVNDTQVSEPVGAGEDGSYTMTVSAADVLLAAGGPGTGITLTAKFVENNNMADGTGTATVNITAAAKAERDGTLLGYYDEIGLNAALADNNNEGAVFTLLKDVTYEEREQGLEIMITCTLDLGGHTIRSKGEYATALNTYGGTTVIIRGKGTVISEHGNGLFVGGTATLEGGTFISGAVGYNGVKVGTGKLIVTSEAVVIENTGGGIGLGVNSGSGATAQLSAGTYGGGTAVTVYGSTTLADLLVEGYAYYNGDTPIALQPDGQALTGTVTVKACTHAYQYAHTTGTTTHSQTCPACGDAKASEKCDFSNGPCPCGVVLAVTLPADLNLTYNGTAQEPGVTVTVDGTPLAASNYEVTYADNINAGTNAAKVTATGKNYTGTTTLTFSIGKATPTITWSSTTQEMTYTGNPAAITAPTVTLVNNESFSGTILYSYTGTSSGDGLPINAGTYKIKASIGTQDNYLAAQSEEMTLTIKKANVTVTAPTANTLTYTGSAQALVTAGTASVGDVVYSTAQDGTYTKNIPTGTNAGTYDVWYKVEGTDNYNGTAPAKVAVTINKANHENVTVETSAKFGASRTYDISGLLPDGAELGNITVSGDIFADPQPAVSEGVLSYTLAADQTNVNKFGTVTVPVTSSTNYNAFNLIIKITVADVDIPELTVDAISVTYTGQPVSDLKISGTAVSNGTPVKGGWSFAPGQALTDVADSSLKEVIFTPEDSTLYGQAKGYAQVQIGKATPTLRLTASPTVTTGGDVTFSLSGLPDGGTANLTCSDEGITVTRNQDGTFTANIPQGGTDTTYTFTAAYAGDSNHEKANALCSVLRKALTELPDSPADDGSNKFKLVMEEGISEVPAGLKDNANLNTPEKLETVMKTKVMEKTSTIPAANTAVYDVALLVSTDGGGNWTAATKDNFPAGGLTVTLPYPSGTDSSYTFTVVHMFTTTDFSKVIGDIETPAVTNTANGLRFTVTGLSPISVGWEKKSSGGSDSSGGGWVSYYSVKVQDSEHGKIISDRTSIYAGGTVTLTVKPDDGYKLDKIAVTDSQNKAVELTEKNGKYTFKMPSRNVTVKADFVPAGSPSPEPTGSPSPLPSGSPTPTTSPSPSPKPWKNPFPDVSNTGWYIKAVEFVCKNGLMAGYENGKFGPNDSITRAQFAQIIYNKAGRPQAGNGVFSDVTTGWYVNAVNWAAAEGIVAGIGGGKFAPDQPISRQDLAVMLWRYAGSPEPRKNELDFSDAGKVSEYAWKALCWANENGIVNGKGNRVLDPKGKATRAEAAQMLKNYIKDQKDKS